MRSTGRSFGLRGEGREGDGCGVGEESGVVARPRHLIRKISIYDIGSFGGGGRIIGVRAFPGRRPT